MVGPYDAVVVGAGPAGLSAASEIAASGARCLVIEQGVAHRARDREDPEQLLGGVGGAGLFSDGKHSFFPSASALWTLPDRDRLRRAYEGSARLLARHGLAPPPFPRDDDRAELATGPAGWLSKRYPSFYLTLEERMGCIAELYEQCGELPWLSARVTGAHRTPTYLALEVEQRGERRLVETRAIVVATGRLSPLWLRQWLAPLGVAFAFRRLELGVRLETLASAPLFARLEGLDPKLSFAGERARFLTFCTCRDGEVVIGQGGDVYAVSGRADGPPTGRSSIGLLARVVDHALAAAITPHVLAARPFRAPLRDLLDVGPASVAAFGRVGAELVADAAWRFVAAAPELERDPDAVVHGPCIEGVGEYPVSTADLALAGGVFVAGDACGRFRGIVASMVSGRYVGASLAR